MRHRQHPLLPARQRCLERRRPWWRTDSPARRLALQSVDPGGKTPASTDSPPEQASLNDFLALAKLDAHDPHKLQPDPDGALYAYITDERRKKNDAGQQTCPSRQSLLARDEITG